MRISDTERREAARKLRALDTHDWYDSADEIDSLESAVECKVFQRFESQTWWHRLADLIDMPKAKREDAGNYWRCGHCGAFSRKDAVTNCFGVIPSRCCGNCGREWER